MLGYPAKVLLKAVEAHGGVDALAKVRQLAGLPEGGTYRMSEPYGVNEIERLLQAVGDVLGMGPREVRDLWVDSFFADTTERWPVWYRTCKSAREFLEIQPEIHHSFAVGVANPDDRRAVMEKFRLEKLANETVMHYRSPHRLCGGYIGLARKVIAYYGDSATIEEVKCVLRGDPECEIHIRWHKKTDRA